MQIVFFIVPPKAAVEWGVADTTILIVYTVAVSITVVLCISTRLLDENIEEHGAAATHVMNFVIHYCAVLLIPWHIAAERAMFTDLARLQSPSSVIRALCLVGGMIAFFCAAFDPETTYSVPFDNLLCFCVLFSLVSFVEFVWQSVVVVIQLYESRHHHHHHHHHHHMSQQTAASPEA